MCPADFLEGKFNLGNVKETSPIEAFNSLAYKKIRKLNLEENKNAIDLCKSCTILYGNANRSWSFKKHDNKGGLDRSEKQKLYESLVLIISMKVFITGINSFVGKRLTEKLDNLSIPYHGIDISGAYSTKVKKLSLNSNNLIKSIENNTSDVVHLAAISREQDCVNNEIKCFDVNISGTINLMDAIIKKRLVK